MSGRSSLLVPLALAAMVWLPLQVAARDTTNLAQTLSPDVQDWVKGLKGINSLSCCDDADGIDPEWQMQASGYRVRFRGEWLRVEPGAVLNEPNRLGVARAWIGFTADTRPYVRCFLPGPSI